MTRSTQSRRSALLACAALMAAPALLPASAFAQDYPTRPIRVIVPFAPGGVVDTTARLLTQKLSERLGWNFVVENKPGGNGFIAVTAAAKAPADGYTLLAAHTGEFAVNPALFPQVPYELDRDFAPQRALLAQVDRGRAAVVDDLAQAIAGNLRHRRALGIGLSCAVGHSRPRVATEQHNAAAVPA